jgi:hypothetical protein
MEEIIKDKVLNQDNPAQQGEQAASPPAEPVPAQQTQEVSPPPENIPYGRFAEVNQQKNEFKEKLEETTRQVDMLTTQLLKQQSPVQMQVQPTQKPVELPKEPNPTDFAEGIYDREYLRQVNDYDFKMNTLKREQETKVSQQESAYRNNFQQHQLRAASLVASNPEYADYYTVAEASPVINHYTQDMVRAMMASPKSAEIAYHLGKNPADAIRVANSPVPALEIGKIEAKLSTPVATKTASMAPQPISPVGNTNAAHEKTPGKDEMSYAEYKAKMNARESEMRKAGTYGRR